MLPEGSLCLIARWLAPVAVAFYSTRFETKTEVACLMTDCSIPLVIIAFPGVTGSVLSERCLIDDVCRCNCFVFVVAVGLTDCPVLLHEFATKVPGRSVAVTMNEADVDAPAVADSWHGAVAHLIRPAIA